VLENGYLQISDQFPIQYRGNPEILLRHNDVYEPALFLNDAMHSFICTTNQTEDTTLTRTLVGSIPGPLTIIEGQDSIIVSASYETPEIRFARDVILKDHETSVSVRIRLTSSNGGEIEQAMLSLWCPHGRSFSEMDIQESLFTFMVTDPWQRPSYVEVSVLGGLGKLSNYSYTAFDPAWELPALMVQIDAISGEIDVMFEFQFASLEFDESTGLGYHDGYEILERYGIDYIYVSRSQGLEIERFEKDVEHFSVAYSNPGVVIFRVI
jgi:hypothetical protein